MNFKLILKKIEKNLTFKNFDKCMNTFDNGLKSFNRGIDDMLKELSSDVKDSNERANSEAKKNNDNINKIWNSKSNVKLWSDRKTKLM